jgi:hypothetical protein
MTKQEIKFRDPVVQSVVNKFVDRSDVGFAKYGKTMRDEEKILLSEINDIDVIDAFEIRVKQRRGHHYSVTIDEED